MVEHIDLDNKSEINVQNPDFICMCLVTEENCGVMLECLFSLCEHKFRCDSKTAVSIPMCRIIPDLRASHADYIIV